MRKNLERRNQVQIYVPDDFIPIWDEFVKITKDDIRLREFQIKTRYKREKALTSLALRLLINRYVKEHQIIKEENTHETPT